MLTHTSTLTWHNLFVTPGHGPSDKDLPEGWQEALAEQLRSAPDDATRDQIVHDLSGDISWRQIRQIRRQRHQFSMWAVAPAEIGGSTRKVMLNTDTPVFSSERKARTEAKRRNRQHPLEGGFQWRARPIPNPLIGSMRQRGMGTDGS